ncbi:hypothetical protein HIM_06410 [Hirsutella minnesotensis 3608]|uniref:75k gamma secalin n=1 Tax=Hirsutella minnesotensis 3608 TaxID=1043627 RepID=A0A0F8A4U3_9HYPO|nr:hypothetical protein HIM_06410 [Hirsutella minnesotensis 3608]
MTYRGTLPSPGQMPFAGQQQEHVYGGPAGGYHQQHHVQQQQQQQQPQVQQQPHHHQPHHHQPHHHQPQQQHGHVPDSTQPAPHDLFGNGIGAGIDHGFYGRSPVQQQQQQQQQFVHRNEFHVSRPLLDRQHQQQQSPQHQQMGQFGMGLDRFSGFDAAARFTPPHHQQQLQQPQQHRQHQQHRSYSPMMQPQMMQFQQQNQAATSPYNMPQAAVQRPPPMRPIQVHQQQLYQSPISSPQLHEQPSPQSRSSSTLPYQQHPSPRPLLQQRQHPLPPSLSQQPHPSPQTRPSPIPTPSPRMQTHRRPSAPPQQQQQHHHHHHQQKPPTPLQQSLPLPSPVPHHHPSPVPHHQPSPLQQVSEPSASVPESHEATPEIQLAPIQEPPPPPQQQEIHFVNPLDILQAPPPRPIVMGSVLSSNLRAPDPPAEEDFKHSVAPVESPQKPEAASTDTIMSEPETPVESIKPETPRAAPPLASLPNSELRKSDLPRPEPPKPKLSRPEPPKSEPPRVKTSPHSSVTNSPALSVRSPSLTKRSPAISSKQRPVNTGPIMVAIAEECLDKARSAVHDVAMSLHPERIDEYQKLIATSLSCLEATLQNCRLAPREEARVRLRYAATLQEETENLMEAETALGKGITLCDKHLDLKYCMQYLMLKVLFQRSHKAALKAVDGHISDCETFNHVQWYYAFRLLKSTFYMEMGSGFDAGALENIRAVQNIANTRGDNALSVLASILEGLILLKTLKEGNIERVQTCIAHAAKFQFDPTVKIMQLEILTLLLDFASSLQHQSPDTIAHKLRLLQTKLDECQDWNDVKADFLVPIKKQPTNAKTVSSDTAAIVRAGDDGTPYDYLVMTFMTKVELRSLVFTFSGLANMHKSSAQGRRSTEFWREGVKILETWDSFTFTKPYGPSVSLATAIRQRIWRIEAQAYLNVLLGLMAASHCQWATVKQMLGKLVKVISPTTQPALKLLSVYLTGVYHQGTGNLQGALHIFKDRCFTVPQGSAGVRPGQCEVTLLAGLNRLWIMQHPSCRNDQETQDLIEQLQPHCTDHWNIDLRTAWHNVVAALETDPPQQLVQQKQHIQAAMAGSKITTNILGAAVTLCIMRSRFFENVIGEQALKSARAASKQAQRSGNVLWQSVADGMLAQSYEVQGQRDESRQEWEKATKEAKDAFPESW